ncbi:MAG TPA: formate dehydrogenase subunit gamma [Vicinamibacterales bacterium]|jgi:formate dehydrogenase subunit gamma
MSTAVERFDDRARAEVGMLGRTVVREGELLRHPVYTRILHWSVAGFFALALLSGFAIYTPWLFRWFTPFLGGGPTTRLLHPWFSLGFVIVFAFQVLNWLGPMSWTPDDNRWMRRLKDFVTNAETLEPEYVDFFNAGQKLYFWAIVGSAAIFLLSGIPMWFPRTFGRAVVAVGYVLHDIAALVMLVGFIAHVYEATASQPGTFQSMTRGTVQKRWAWTHHPAWYRKATGRDPRADYEAAVANRSAARAEGERREPRS